MIDTHCHLDVAAFDADRDAVVARAKAAGVSGILVPAIRPSTWATLVEIVGRDPLLYVAMGVHPQVVPDLSADELSSVDDLVHVAVNAGACAIGECGLDGATGDLDRQEELFRRQLRVARELRLPVIVHVLRAHDRAPRVMREERVDEIGGVMHSYSGGPDLVRVYLDLGLHLSFAGPVTYENARKPAAAARLVPRDRLLAETDAPDQTPIPFRGQRCEPAFVADVIAGLARARGESTAEVAAYTEENARRLFRLG